MTHEENFITKSNKRFNNKFDYSRFVYIKAKTKSVIICPEHGEFEQSPDKHLSSVYACRKCEHKYKIRTSRVGISNEAKRLTKEEFTERFSELHGTKYTLNMDSYTGLCGSDIIVVCEKHGESLRSPINLMQASFSCVECANESRAKNKTASYESVIIQLNIAHQSRYSYPIENEMSYVNKKSKLKIICKEHGEFVKSTQKHLSGQGCFNCKIAEMIQNKLLLGGYSDSYFLNNPSKKNSVSVLYYIKVGNAYKIGITTNFYNRLRSIKSESKKEVDVIFQKEYNLFEAFTIEQTILTDFDEYRTYRNWSTEIFSVDIRDNIIKYF